MLSKDSPAAWCRVLAWRCYHAWRGESCRRRNSAVFCEWTVKLPISHFSENILSWWLELIHGHFSTNGGWLASLPLGDSGKRWEREGSCNIDAELNSNLKSSSRGPCVNLLLEPRTVCFAPLVALWSCEVWLPKQGCWLSWEKLQFKWMLYPQSLQTFGWDHILGAIVYFKKKGKWKAIQYSI